MTNRCTIEQLREMTVEQVSDLPLDQIAALHEDVADLKADAKRLDDLLHMTMLYRFGRRADDMRAAEGKDTGTVSLIEGDFKIAADRPKKVEWNQALLRDAEAIVRGWGEDPADYLTTMLSVPESRYSAWPESIRKVFEPARTVSAGKPTFKVERAKTGRRAA